MFNLNEIDIIFIVLFVSILYFEMESKLVKLILLFIIYFNLKKNKKENYDLACNDWVPVSMPIECTNCANSCTSRKAKIENIITWFGDSHKCVCDNS